MNDNSELQNITQDLFLQFKFSFRCIVQKNPLDTFYPFLFKLFKSFNGGINKI